MSRSAVPFRLPGERAPHGGVPTREEPTMKYLLMMHTPSGGPYQIASWPKQDIKAHIAFMVSFAKKLGESGELVAAEGLAGPDQAKRVRAGADGKPITDGVFPESKEFLAGYWIVDVESQERAARRNALMTETAELETQHLLRALAPQVLGIVVRRFRDFSAAEDAVQEALIAAATQWPREGRPESPRAWLIQVAARRMADHVRTETARRQREQVVVSLVPPDEQVTLALDGDDPAARDDTLELLFLCCHPALSPASAIALT